MTRKDILKFVEKNPVFSLATIDGDKPRVRMMMLAMVNEKGLVFTTGRDKAVCKQMTANPAIEMCFYSADEGRQVRIEGKAEALDDLKLKKQIVEKFTFLKPWVEKEGYEVMMPYRVKNARGTVWTMETNFQPKEFIEL
jgi:pyridoxamine 5'-phosphate oxidase